MDENTTTDSNIQAETGAVDAQPVEQNVPEAAEQATAPEPSADTPDVTPEANESGVDDKLQKYAQSQGIELDSPSAIKAAQIAMKAQSEATRNYQKASELEKNLTTTSDVIAENEAERTGQDPELLKRLQRVEVKETVRDFWNKEGIDRSMEPKMIELLGQKPHLAGDLDSLYAVAVMESGNVASVKTQGKREALESLAHKQQAAVPRGNATNSSTTPAKKDFKDLSISEMEAQLGKVRR